MRKDFVSQALPHPPSTSIFSSIFRIINSILAIFCSWANVSFPSVLFYPYFSSLSHIISSTVAIVCSWVRNFSQRRLFVSPSSSPSLPSSAHDPWSFLFIHAIPDFSHLRFGCASDPTSSRSSSVAFHIRSPSTRFSHGRVSTSTEPLPAPCALSRFLKAVRRTCGWLEPRLGDDPSSIPPTRESSSLSSPRSPIRLSFPSPCTH